MTPEHFAGIYGACDMARLPREVPYPVADWWRALMSFAYVTGWRIGDMLALRRADLDLQTGHAITRFEDNKGDRDARIRLQDVVVDHLNRIPSLDLMVFPWHYDRRTLDDEIDRIQVAGEIKLPRPRRHTHTDACHVYSFHDFRRAFPTLNAARLTPDALQALMRHKSYLTTQVYINLSRQLDEAAAKIYVPDFLKEKKKEA